MEVKLNTISTANVFKKRDLTATKKGSFGRSINLTVRLIIWREEGG